MSGTAVGHGTPISHRQLTEVAQPPLPMLNGDWAGYVLLWSFGNSSTLIGQFPGGKPGIVTALTPGGNFGFGPNDVTPGTYNYMAHGPQRPLWHGGEIVSVVGTGGPGFGTFEYSAVAPDSIIMNPVESCSTIHGITRDHDIVVSWEPGQHGTVRWTINEFLFNSQDEMVGMEWIYCSFPTGDGVGVVSSKLLSELKPARWELIKGVTVGPYLGVSSVQFGKVSVGGKFIDVQYWTDALLPNGQPPFRGCMTVY